LFTIVQVENRMTKQLKASQMQIAKLEASAEEAKQVHANTIADLATDRGNLKLSDQQLKAAQVRVQELMEGDTRAKETKLQSEVEGLVTQVEALQVPH
jgi:hypothetical protein